jgi:hypothetical protein
MPATVEPGAIAAVATATLSPAERMIQGNLSNVVSLGNARCIGESALILFFIYNKHFQVNGNIDPVDEGGNEPQATGNKLKVV